MFGSSSKNEPHSERAEQVLLASLIKNEALFDRVSHVLSERSFYKEPHKYIFRAISELVKKNFHVSAVTINDYLENNSLLSMVGSSYVDDLLKEALSSEHLLNYVSIIHDRYLRRMMLALAEEATQSCIDTEGRSTQDILDTFQEQLLSLSSDSVDTTKPLLVSNYITPTLNRIEETRKTGGKLHGYVTGFHDIDRLTGGFQAGDLVVLAARPSMGKTALSLDFTLQAIYNKVPVLYFSLEMPADQIVMRLISMLSGVDHDLIKRGQLHDLTSISEAINKLTQSSLFIDESSSLSISSIRTRARMVARELEAKNQKLGAIIIDYLQLIRGTSIVENRTVEVSEISRGLKALAKELKLPVIALAQLNRGLEARTNKRPVMSDLRESGAIEQDADLIMFIYRDEYYNPATPDKGIAEIIISKHRNGPTGVIQLIFKPERGSFKNKQHE